MAGEKGRFEQLLRLLPEGWEAKAKELGAFKRARGIKTPGELLQLILLYLTSGKSFAGTSALTQLTGETELPTVPCQQTKNGGNHGFYTVNGKNTNANLHFAPYTL